MKILINICENIKDLLSLRNIVRDMTQEEDIKNAVKVLREGGVILYPTDTVWGIGCDATNAKAVAKVYDI